MGNVEITLYISTANINFGNFHYKLSNFIISVDLEIFHPINYDIFKEPLSLIILLEEKGRISNIGYITIKYLKWNQTIKCQRQPVNLQ